MTPRERLLDAAVRCLARDGWARTTTRRIAEEAGANVPDVNYYFGTKDALMREAATFAARRWAERPLAELATARDVAPRRALADNLARFLADVAGDRRHDAMAFFEAVAQVRRDPALGAAMARLYEDWRATVASELSVVAGTEDGSLTRSVAGLLMAIYDGLAVQVLVDGDVEIDPDELVGALDALAAAVAVDVG